MAEQERRRWAGYRRWSLEQTRRAISAAYDCARSSSPRDLTRRFYCYVRRLTDAFAMHQCSLMACACAYCALLSLVPLLIVGIAVLGYIMGGSQNALHQVIVAIRGYVPVNPDFLKEMLLRILNDRGLIGLFGIVGLLYAAHQTFLAMEPAMNIIWAIPETRHWLRQRLVALGATLLTLALLAADLAASALFAALEGVNVPFIPTPFASLLTRFAAGLLPVVITTFLFAMLYRLLPSRTVPFKPACIGAGVAALLWEGMKLGFGVFLVYVHSYDRLYGSLSGLVILVVWAYYSMASLLLGAEIAADYEARRHSMREAEERAHSGADLAAAHGTAQQLATASTEKTAAPEE